MRQFPNPHRFRIFFYMHSVPFTSAVIDKVSSLGGSESACIVLAEGLAARGHDVHIFGTQFLPDLADEYARAEKANQVFARDGVSWHAADDLPGILAFEQPDVFISLRMTDIFRLNIPAKLRILWNQDLLVDDSVVGNLYNVDQTFYVSEYHREQWCQRHPMLRPTAFVTPNPIDLRNLELGTLTGPGGAELIGATVRHLPKVPARFIHVTRPERGLDGLLALWPKIRARIPNATMRICRYDSMYDAGGWGAICERYDRKVRATNDRYGGLEYIGNLNKRELYIEIAQAVGMLYPTTQVNFAETNCIACTEAQACGTPFVGSWKGALPETLGAGAGILIDGDVLTDGQVQDRWVEAAAYLAAAAHPEPMPDLPAGADLGQLMLALDGQTYGPYREMRTAGFTHVNQSATADLTAGLWEHHLRSTFEERYQRNRIKVLRTLLQWDNHAPAMPVCEDILNDPASTPAERDEAREAYGLCERVIAQTEQTAADYAKFAIQDPAVEAAGNGRLQYAAKQVLAAIAGVDEPQVLDVACGNGSMALLLLRSHPKLRVYGYDYSPGVLKLAREAADKEGFGDRLHLTQGDWTELAGTYHAVFCGEFLEHVEKPWEVLDRLESHCKAGGRVTLTTPAGPFAELLQPGIPRQRGHVHAFSHRDLAEMCAGKADFNWRYIGMGVSPRGTSCGYWVFGFAQGGGAAIPMDYTSTILTERPYQRVVAMMIVKNEAGSLYKCLTSIAQVVDRIVIYDSGSDDGSQEIARQFGAEIIEGTWPDHFAAARNIVLDHVDKEAEWLFWIDADEQLEDGVKLRHYAVDAGPYLGYVIRQHHLQVDAPNFFDKPVRLFRARRGIRFFGDVHEQPETARDKGITPALDQTDMKIVHLGYHTSRVRHRKLLERNLRLLMRAIHSGNARQLDYVLYMRDLVNTAVFDMQAANGMTTKAYKHLIQTTRVYHQRFADPTHMLHPLAWPFYQQALDMLGSGVEISFGFAAAAGSLEGRKPGGQTFKAQTPEEGEAYVTHKVRTWMKQLAGTPIDTEPVIDRLPLLRSPHAKLVEEAVREAAPAQFGDNRRVRAWAWLFVQHLAQHPGPVLEIGTWKGGSALVWLRLLRGLYSPTGHPATPPMVYTVDPYGGKPYGDGPDGPLPLFGDAEYTAMKARLAEFPNHAHFLMEGDEFLTYVAGNFNTWRDGREELVGNFSFVLLDGDHSADTITRELAALYEGEGVLAPEAVIVVDNVEFDPDTVHTLVDRYHVSFVDAKWGQRFAIVRGRRKFALPERPAGDSVQTSA